MAGNPVEVVKDYIDSKFAFLRPEFNKENGNIHVFVQDSLVLNKLMDADENAKSLQSISLKDFNTFADEAIDSRTSF